MIKLKGGKMNVLSKTLIGLSLLGLSGTSNASTIFNGEYEYRGNASNNLVSPGDPHNLIIVDSIFCQCANLGEELEALVVDGLTVDETPRSGFNIYLESVDDYAFDWGVSSSLPWKVVGLGVKAGNTNHYFELEPNAELDVTGTFDLFDELTEEGFMEGQIKAVSHVDIFGVKFEPPVLASAPASGILAALGFAGIAAFRRKKK
jgi:hypothetical protein